MKENEHILDSGEIYEEGKLELDPLEIKESEFDRIELIPLVPGGNSGKTHRFIYVDSNEIEIVPDYGFFWRVLDIIPTTLPPLLWIVFMFIDILGIFGMLVVLFIYLAILILHSFIKTINLNTKIVFNKRSGLYWIKKMTFISFNKTVAIRLKDIKAVQIVKEEVKQTETVFEEQVDLIESCFELNLILKDNSRRNLIDHSEGNSILYDAKQLAKFLNVPLYNGKVKIEPGKDW